MNPTRRRFRILGEIAEGGFGKVYLAEQLSSDGFSRVVAVKLLHAKWSSHDEVVKRTRDEARLLGRIRHQNIVRVEDLTTIDGKCALVMEYLEGVDLKWLSQWYKNRGEVFPRAALFEVASAVASALDAAFNGTPLQGSEPLRVIHRDIKPSNVFLTTTGGVKVLDFGTARANFAEREARTQALAFGSQGYMAPERMLGEEDTPAADVFSLAVTLVEMLTQESFGRIPPRPQKFNTRLDEVIASLPLSDEPPGWADQARLTLRQMLSYDPLQRPSPASLVDTLESLGSARADESLKKVCRGAVGAAKAALPKPESDDPLVSRVVEEDTSGLTQNSGPMPKPLDVQNPAATGPLTMTPPPATDATGPVEEKPDPTWDEAPTGVQDGGPKSVTPPPQRRTPAPTPLTGLSIDDVGKEFEQPRQGLAFGVMALGLAAVALLGIAGALVGLIVVIGASSTGSTAGSEPAEGSAVAPDGSTVASAPVAPPAPEPGGRVVSPDGRAGVASSPTLLQFSDPVGGVVVVANTSGFRAEWDGRAPFEIGPLGEGRYSTVVTMASGEKVRGKSFHVEGGRGVCRFTFDATTRDWTGGCQ